MRTHHHLKRLGSTFLALLIFSALSASAAGAVQFHSESAPASYKGEQTSAHTFTTSAGSIQCSTATFEGTSAATTTSELELAPSFSGCKFAGFASATVQTNGCKFRFTPISLIPPSLKVDITCPVGKDITLTALGCTVHISAQTLLAHVTFTGTLSLFQRDLDLSATIKGIKVKATSGCPGGEVSSEAEYTGGITLKGFTSGGTQQGIWLE